MSAMSKNPILIAGIVALVSVNLAVAAYFATKRDEPPSKVVCWSADAAERGRTIVDVLAKEADVHDGRIDIKEPITNGTADIGAKITIVPGSATCAIVQSAGAAQSAAPARPTAPTPAPSAPTPDAGPATQAEVAPQPTPAKK